MVIFAPQNLIMDPPFTKLDISELPQSAHLSRRRSCRRNCFPLFHYSLNPRRRAVPRQRGEHRRLHRPRSRRCPASRGSFRRRIRGAAESRSSFPRTSSPSPQDSAEDRADAAAVAATSFQALAEQWLLQRSRRRPRCWSMTRATSFSSAAAPGSYLEPAAGKANWNIFAMAREGLRYELASAFQKARRSKGARDRPRDSSVGVNGGTQFVDAHGPAARGTGDAARAGDDRVHRSARACRPSPKARPANPRGTKRAVRELELERAAGAARKCRARARKCRPRRRS